MICRHAEVNLFYGRNGTRQRAVQVRRIVERRAHKSRRPFDALCTTIKLESADLWHPLPSRNTFVVYAYSIHDITVATRDWPTYVRTHSHSKCSVYARAYTFQNFDELRNCEITQACVFTAWNVPYIIQLERCEYCPWNRVVFQFNIFNWHHSAMCVTLYASNLNTFLIYSGNNTTAQIFIWIFDAKNMVKL